MVKGEVMDYKSVLVISLVLKDLGIKVPDAELADRITTAWVIVEALRGEQPKPTKLGEDAKLTS